MVKEVGEKNAQSFYHYIFANTSKPSNLDA